MSRWLLSIALFLSAFLPVSAFSLEGGVRPLTPAIASELYNPIGTTVAGNPNGKITMVEFFDYNCHFCRSMQPVIEDLIKKNPELRVVYKEFLLFGESSLLPVKAAFAAQQQGKYIALHDALLKATNPLTETEILRIAGTVGIDTQKLQTAMNSPAVDLQARATTSLIDTIGIDGAPTFIIANADVIKSPQKPGVKQYFYMGSDDDSEAALQNILDRAAKDTIAPTKTTANS